ncbi:DUF805 domain-containing protein [Phenylobacterium sp. VNQ135]|uniref:DUF805 domain-containing protein n=1 Tax=Phenylobacterium sp. VNQ135 TaxID=3400922 RepID=UPI003BFA9D6C
MTGPLHTFLSLKGTASRREWWTVAAFCGVLHVTLLVLGFATGLIYLAVSAWQNWLLLALQNVVLGLLLAPVSIRRLRDRRMSPWWYAVLPAWALAAPHVLRMADDADRLVLGNAIQIAGMLLGLFVMVQLALLPSKAAPEAGLTDAAAPGA